MSEKQYLLSDTRGEDDYIVGYIAEREEGIKEIESTLIEVNEVYKDLADLVTTQGEQLDNIAFTMTETSNHVEGGVKEITKASRYQKKSRNKACIILVVVTVVLAILIIVVITTRNR
jgi:t-SNARE complex subunit (syntaxin)